MRYRLLASAGLAAIALALGVTAATTTASAEDCGCRDRVRAALARQAPIVPKPAVRRAAPRPQAQMASNQAYAERHYDYRGQSAVDMGSYRQRWEAAPQGYVPPPEGYGPPADMYGPPMEAAPAYGAPMAYGPAHGMAFGQSYGEGWAYDYRPAITIDQGGWFGGVGYGMGADGGGGGGGGGLTLTLAQPDAANGYAPGPMGAWGATNQVNQWRAEAFAPKK